MSAGAWIGLATAAAILIYLVYTLIRPARF
jgi:K+-transporting ATPase KdpF subunit